MFILIGSFRLSFIGILHVSFTIREVMNVFIQVFCISLHLSIDCIIFPIDLQLLYRFWDVLDFIKLIVFDVFVLDSTSVLITLICVLNNANERRIVKKSPEAIKH